MNIWDKLLETNVQNQDRFAHIFSEIVRAISQNKYHFSSGSIENEDYFIVHEEQRAKSFFVSIVPKEVYALFKEMQERAPNEFLGYSVLAGKKDGRDVRVTCFGVPCAVLAKSLTKKP